MYIVTKSAEVEPFRQIRYHVAVMNGTARIRREVSELWLATVFLVGIVLLSGLLHCCVFGGDDHRRSAPLCAQFADALARTGGEHSTTTPAKPTWSETMAGSAVSVPLYLSDRACVAQHLTRTSGPCARRNAMTLGSMRTDDDVGVHDLNATYLI